MDALPFSTVDLKGSEIDSILEIYNKLKEKFPVELKIDFSFDFENFELFRSHSQNNIGPVIHATNKSSSFFITFTQVAYKLANANRWVSPATLEYQMWSILFLKQKTGHILIRPETLLDKIHEIINPIELAFEDDKGFNKKFYVITNDELKARQFLTPLLRSFIRNIKLADFVIEILDNKLIVGNRRTIDTTSTLLLAEFLDSVSQSL